MPMATRPVFGHLGGSTAVPVALAVPLFGGGEAKKRRRGACKPLRSGVSKSTCLKLRDAGDDGPALAATLEPKKLRMMSFRMRLVVAQSMRPALPW